MADLVDVVGTLRTGSLTQANANDVRLLVRRAHVETAHAADEGELIGTVTSGGQQFIPDAGVGFYKFFDAEGFAFEVVEAQEVNGGVRLKVRPTAPGESTARFE